MKKSDNEESLVEIMPGLSVNNELEMLVIDLRQIDREDIARLNTYIIDTPCRSLSITLGEVDHTVVDAIRDKLKEHPPKDLHIDLRFYAPEAAQQLQELCSVPLASVHFNSFLVIPEGTFPMYATILKTLNCPVVEFGTGILEHYTVKQIAQIFDTIRHNASIKSFTFGWYNTFAEELSAEPIRKADIENLILTHLSRSNLFLRLKMEDVFDNIPKVFEHVKLADFKASIHDISMQFLTSETNWKELKKCLSYLREIRSESPPTFFQALPSDLKKETLKFINELFFTQIIGREITLTKLHNLIQGNEEMFKNVDVTFLQQTLDKIKEAIVVNSDSFWELTYNFITDSLGDPLTLIEELETNIATSARRHSI